MADFPRVILHNRKADAVRRFHPWIFSGAIQKVESGVAEGDVVAVYSASGEYLATGHYASGNIAVKILSFQPVESLEQLFVQRFQAAYGLRKQAGLVGNAATTCYRLVNAEGDGLPGLIVDWYNGTAVLQAYSLGMVQQRELIATCLQSIYGNELKAIYDKSATVMPKLSLENAYLLGDRSHSEVQEYGHRFEVNWEEGQKTGLFLDQRENRQLLAKYAAEKRVLNTFCYSGGFSVYAVQSGAALVHSVDSSVKAIAWTEENVALNNPQQVPHEVFARDVFEFLKSCDAEYDLIVLDPPAFAKNLSARHSAVMAYKRLNKMAFDKLRPNGIVFTFSCSQVVTPDLFQGAVMAGAIESGRQIRILNHLTQPADHPVSIYHPEGLYLKGLVLAVE
ncbi:MAG: class I SAM-dependent rRNA methyltransferase [Oscillatoriales cyanobacterium C42_A2020_001]|nr:class I SAM-dependent rRNA methyltransferase [Leptolyngbyaceae cyanobacterium C42_A2020_001]